MQLEGVELAIALFEQERLDILGEEEGAEIIKDMPHFDLLDEVKRLRKLIENAWVESRFASAGLAGFAMRVAPNDPGIEAVLQRIAKIEKMLTPN